MPVRLIEAESDLRDLHDEAERADTIRCDPSQPHHPSWDELAEYDGDVVGFFDDQGPAMYALQREGRIKWLCHIRPSKQAVYELSKFIAEKEGRCTGTVENPEVRALFDQPSFWHDGKVYLEWRP